MLNFYILLLFMLFNKIVLFYLQSFEFMKVFFVIKTIWNYFDILYLIYNILYCKEKYTKGRVAPKFAASLRVFALEKERDAQIHSNLGCVVWSWKWELNPSSSSVSSPPSIYTFTTFYPFIVNFTALLRFLSGNFSKFSLKPFLAAEKFVGKLLGHSVSVMWTVYSSSFSLTLF